MDPHPGNCTGPFACASRAKTIPRTAERIKREHVICHTAIEIGAGSTGSRWQSAVPAFPTLSSNDTGLSSFPFAGKKSWEYLVSRPLNKDDC